MPTSSLSHAYTSDPFRQSPLDAELAIVKADATHLRELNRELESKLVVRNLALRQVLSLLENEVRHRTNLSEAVKNIRTLLETE